MSGSFPIVVLAGSPFERGRQHGQRFRDGIVAALAATRRERPAVEYAAARRKAEAAWPAILRDAPDVADELRGIAEGAAADRTEILLHVGFEFFDTPSPTGCTAIACKGPRGAIVAQNWDALPALAQTLALFIHTGPNGFELAAIASIGGLAWVGVNRHGLALVNNDLMLKSRRPGLPSQIVRRIVLGKRDVEEALGILQVLPHMAGRSYLVGDSSGDVAGIEVSASRGVRVTRGGVPILHTNHALDLHIREDEDESLLMKTYPSSHRRLDTLRRFSTETSSVDSLMAVLRNRDGFPDSISKAPSDGEPTMTAFSIIADCGNHVVHVAAGPPADHAYRAFVL